jgi:hypothetical protein
MSHQKRQTTPGSLPLLTIYNTVFFKELLLKYERLS